MKHKALATLLFSGALVTSTLATAAATTDQSGAAPLSPAQTKQIEQVVHNYLVSNPQVLVEASQSLQQQQMSQMQKSATKAIAKNLKDLVNNSKSPVIGNPNGDVTIVEFMDYQCGHCKEMAPVMDEVIKGDPQVRVVYKEFPIFGATSQLAAKAALAAMKQGKFAAFHDALMGDQNPLTQDEIMKLAQSVGLDTAKLSKDMNDPAISAELKDNYRLATELGLMGTPAIIIANRNGSKTAFIPGTTSKANIQQLISQMRQ